ncbi:Ltp family lipoprotein [Mycobacterium sp. 23]|uniref:Ltp family lipoprotein n=1 Tax=Mycobacterium sp. 23 TaxID=3400424 RepID=UPI003AAB2370
MSVRSVLAMVVVAFGVLGVAPGAQAAPAPLTPQSQQNAVRTAKDYLDMAGYSRAGLIKQLQYEGFSVADATYAVDSLSVDWNAQAVRTAKDYLDMSGYSHSGLVKQLMYEGYTAAQAEYGVSAVGL